MLISSPLPGNSALGATLELMSRSTGSVVADVLVGGMCGWLLTPRGGDRVAWVAGGAAATGLAGVLGLLGLVYVSHGHAGRRK